MMYIPSTRKTATCPYCEKEIRNVHGEFVVHFMPTKSAKIGFYSPCCEGSLKKV